MTKPSRFDGRMPTPRVGSLECCTNDRYSPLVRPTITQGDIMRSLVALLTTFAFVACSTPPATRDQSHPPNASMNPAVEFLLTSAATDFHIHRPPHPVRVRDVRSGYVLTPDGTRQYRLCGEFLPAQEGGKAEWAPFVTIKTSGYEQYLGAQAVSFCSPSSMTWDKGDLSSSLQSRLDALR
jgi:hypothetical protein